MLNKFLIILLLYSCKQTVVLNVNHKKDTVLILHKKDTLALKDSIDTIKIYKK
jgi:hypothetical protein